jgi:hypothetical protein
VTNNVTDQWIIQLLTVLQQQHCISDVVTANNCVTLKYATSSPSADLHYHCFGHASSAQIASRGSAEIMKQQAGDASSLASVLPCSPKITNPLSTGSSENVFVSRLSLVGSTESRKALLDGI